MDDPTTKRAARYVRVSRTEQKLSLQLDETAELIRRRGWSLVDTFTDQGVSGAKRQRPELNRLLDQARRRTFDILVVWRSDRLFRSLKHMVVTLDEIGALGVDFVSVSEPFDTTTPQGRLLLHLVAAMAEFERELIRERTRAGLAAARRRGVSLGRPPVEIDMDEVMLMRSKGMSIRQVAKALGVSASSVHRALKKRG
ncbi:MAG TPA: recombinase family protein [Polyangiaceae bacterium]|nr:recombinase family protein [Polyangiaceae bacterium]